MALPRLRIALLFILTAGCDSPTPPQVYFEDDQVVIVRGRVSVEGDKKIDLTQVSLKPATNFPDCTGTLPGNYGGSPDASGFYTSTAAIPRALPSRRCVWVIASTRIDGILYRDTAGGVPATFRLENGRVPPDTVEIDIVLRRIGAQ
jgi:hypothetical protein